MNKAINGGTEICKLNFKRYNKVVKLTAILLSKSMKIQSKLILNCFVGSPLTTGYEHRLHPRSHGDDFSWIQAVIVAPDRFFDYKNKGFVGKM